MCKFFLDIGTSDLQKCKSDLQSMSIRPTNIDNPILQTFSLRQTDGEHIKSRIIYPTTSPSAHKVGKNVSWGPTKLHKPTYRHHVCTVQSDLYSYRSDQ